MRARRLSGTAKLLTPPTSPLLNHHHHQPPLQVFLTTTHLGIAMEYASGGELFDRIVRANRFSEDEARYFFQQLISGVAWCHKEVRAVAGRRRLGGGWRGVAGGAAGKHERQVHQAAGIVICTSTALESSRRQACGSFRQHCC